MRAAVRKNSGLSGSIIFDINFCLFCRRFRKQKVNQKALLRCQQKSINGGTGGVMDGVPALLQGLNGRPIAGEDDEGVFYDELISYPPQFRAPNHPPAYEV